MLEGHGPLIKDIPKNVTVRSFKYKLFGKLSRFDPNLRLSLLTYVKNIKPDLIHGHLFRGEDYAKVVGFITKTPVITTSHDVLVHPGTRSKFFNHYVKKAVAVSVVVADHLKNIYGLSDNKIIIIPNAIETGLFSKGIKKFNKKKPVSIYIGRILKSKGIEDAILGVYPNLEMNFPISGF